MSHQDEFAIQEVIQTEREWVEAHRRLNLATLERIMADDYTHIQTDGSVIGKEEDLASYQTGTRHWEFAESDQYDVRMYGDTAILIGRWRARGVNAGERFDYSARFTAVYVKRKGHWQMVLTQSTPFTDAG